MERFLKLTGYSDAGTSVTVEVGHEGRVALNAPHTYRYVIAESGVIILSGRGLGVLTSDRGLPPISSVMAGLLDLLSEVRLSDVPLFSDHEDRVIRKYSPEVWLRILDEMNTFVSEPRQLSLIA